LSPKPLSSKPPGIISSLLSPACAALLRTQVSEVESLDIQIAAGDRQILSGTIPSVTILATKTVYRGVSLQKIKLLADQIEINLGQVIRGKPLRLLQPITVELAATITEADLLSSLTAPLLANAVNELISQAIGLPMSDWSLVWQEVKITHEKLTLQGLVQKDHQSSAIHICTGIGLISGQIIQLEPLTVVCDLMDRPSAPTFSIDLGPEVNLSELILQDRELYCAGQVQIRP
jgi:LmeA-like phospholipid-binding